MGLIPVVVTCSTGFTIDKDFGVTVEDSATRAQERAQKALKDCRTVDEKLSPERQIDAIAECLQRGLERELNVTDEEISFQAGVRKEMGEMLKQYTCEDSPLVEVKTTPSVENTTLFNHDVKVLFESEYSSVRIVEGFLNEQQCNTLLQLSSSGAVTPSQLDPGVIRKLKTMMPQPMQLPFGHYSDTTTTTEDIKQQPQLQIIVDEATVVVADDKQECEVQADGSCLAAADSDDSSATESSGAGGTLRSVLVDDDTIKGRLLLICRSEDTTGGLIFFPKTGVRIAEPASGDAVVIVYQDLTSGTRDEDPFLDEHMICPIRRGKAVALEEVYYAR